MADTAKEPAAAAKQPASAPGMSTQTQMLVVGAVVIAAAAAWWWYRRTRVAVAVAVAGAPPVAALPVVAAQPQPPALPPAQTTLAPTLAPHAPQPMAAVAPPAAFAPFQVPPQRQQQPLPVQTAGHEASRPEAPAAASHNHQRAEPQQLTEEEYKHVSIPPRSVRRRVETDAHRHERHERRSRARDPASNPPQWTKPRTPPADKIVRIP